MTKCKEEALADKREYIDLIDISVRAIIKEEVKTQLPQILPQVVSEFATPVIERNIIESLEAVILAKSSSQPKSTYEEAALLSDQSISDRLSYSTQDLLKPLLRVEVFTLKRSQDDKDKDQDPSTGSDRGTKRRKSSKDVESSRDLNSKESKSTSSSKGTSHSQHKSSSKSAYAEEPSHTVDDS
ncbi:hypothetical protein Tco_1070594 [Tanacetum coccineum]|uniref:GED domain-containing protein n=1 Tax=Tanacetum coccineum TaxID=301880 RepID=A0ABQ5HLV4_9ASTR